MEQELKLVFNMNVQKFIITEIPAEKKFLKSY